MSSKTENELLDDLTDFVSSGDDFQRRQKVQQERFKRLVEPTLTEAQKKVMNAPMESKRTSPCTKFLLIVSPVIALCLLMVAAMALNAMFGLIIYPLSLLWNPLPNDAVKYSFGLGMPAVLVLIYLRCRAAHR